MGIFFWEYIKILKNFDKSNKIDFCCKKNCDGKYIVKIIIKCEILV